MSRSSLCERAAGVSRRGVNDHACRLVDDEEVLVRVRDRELGQCDGRLRRGRHRRLDLDLLPARELVALPASLPVHQHSAGVEQALRRGPRAHLR